MENQVYSSEEDYEDCYSTASQSPSYNEDNLGAFHNLQNSPIQKVVRFTTLYINNNLTNTNTTTNNDNQSQQENTSFLTKTNQDMSSHFTTFLNEISENQVIFKHEEIFVGLSEIQNKLPEFFQENSKINNSDYLSICFEGEINEKYYEIVDMGNLNGKTMCEGRIFNFNQNINQQTSYSDSQIKQLIDIEKITHLIEIYGKLSQKQQQNLLQPYQQLLQLQQQQPIIISENIDFQI